MKRQTSSPVSIAKKPRVEQKHCEQSLVLNIEEKSIELTEPRLIKTVYHLTDDSSIIIAKQFSGLPPRKLLVSSTTAVKITKSDIFYFDAIMRQMESRADPISALTVEMREILKLRDEMRLFQHQMQAFMAASVKVIFHYCS